MKRLLKKITPEFIKKPIRKKLAKTKIYDIFDSKQVIFIHIPKAAGTSIGKSLFGTGRTGHYSLNDYYKVNKKKARNYYKFTFVRNPYDRLVSAFFYLKQGGKNESDIEFSKENLSQIDSFEDFVLNWLTDERLYSWIHFYPQVYFTECNCSSLTIDFIGKLENIDKDVRTLSKMISQDIVIEHHNASSRKHYSEYFTEEMKEKVYDLYKEDFLAFDYEKDSIYNK